MNHCIFVGNFVADPQVRTVNGVKGDVSVVTFKIGVNNRISKDKTEAAFPMLEAWGAQAELIGKHFKKGDLIRVYARLRSDSWTDKESGETKYGDKFVVEKIEFCESKKAPGGADREDEPVEAEAEASTPPKGKGKGKGKGKVKEPVAAAVSEDDDDNGDDENIPF